MEKLRILKQELRANLGYSKATFLRYLKILCGDPRTPFTYAEITRGHYIKSKYADYIQKNL